MSRSNDGFLYIPEARIVAKGYKAFKIDHGDLESELVERAISTNLRYNHETDIIECVFNSDVYVYTAHFPGRGVSRGIAALRRFRERGLHRQQLRQIAFGMVDIPRLSSTKIPTDAVALIARKVWGR